MLVEPQQSALVISKYSVPLILSLYLNWFQFPLAQLHFDSRFKSSVPTY